MRNCKRFQTVQSSRFTTCMFDFKSSQGIQCGLVVYSWGAEALCLRACHAQTILREPECLAAGKTAENTYAEGIGRGAQVFGGCSQIGRQRVRHCFAVGANCFDIHGVSENNAQMRQDQRHRGSLLFAKTPESAGSSSR